jgi:phage terminase small subunit
MSTSETRRDDAVGEKPNTGSVGKKPKTKSGGDKPRSGVHAKIQKRLIKYEQAIEEGYSMTAEEEEAFQVELLEFQQEWKRTVIPGRRATSEWDQISAHSFVAENKLSRKQTLFVEYFLRYRNSFRAAAAAGYKDPTKASDFLTYMCPKIQREIQRKLDLVSARNAITTQKVVEELTNVAMTNLGDFIEIGEDGAEATLTFKWADRGHMSALKEITQETYVVQGGRGEDGDSSKPVVKKTAIRMHDKLRALEHLSKLLNLYPEDKDPGEGTRMAQTIMEAVRKMKELQGVEKK